MSIKHTEHTQAAPGPAVHVLWSCEVTEHDPSEGCAGQLTLCKLPTYTCLHSGSAHRRKIELALSLVLALGTSDELP